MKITTNNILRIWKENPNREFKPEDLENVYFSVLSMKPNLPFAFIKKFAKYLLWNRICTHQKLDSKFLDKFKKEITQSNSWYEICQYQKLSMKYIKNNLRNLELSVVCIYQKLSESFLEKNAHKFSKREWELISKYQKLSKKFIKKHESKLNLCYIGLYQKTNPITAKKFIQTEYSAVSTEIVYSNLTTYWSLNKIKELLKNSPYKIYACKNSGDQYITAWKAVRIDRYSLFSFHYKYEKGKTYKSHCNNYLEDLNSFGLSAWTKEQARKYGNNSQSYKFKLIKVKIYLKDIGAVLPNENYKIRARKLTVMT